MDGKKRQRPFFTWRCLLGCLLLILLFLSADGYDRLLSGHDGQTSLNKVLDKRSPKGLIKPVVVVSSQNICPGTFVALSVTAANATSYAWYINNVPLGLTNSTFGYTGFKDQDQVTCYVTDAGGGAFSDPVIITVGDNTAPAVNIFATSANTCKGTSVTFTAVIVNGGTAPIYQWRVNDIPMAFGPSYTTSTLQNSDDVTCVLISNAKCVVPTPVSSYAIHMNVSEVVQPAGNIIATNTRVCEGTLVDFSMSMSIGAPVNYQWKVNGINVSTNPTFSSANLADQDVISCDLIVSTQCSTSIPFSPVSFKIDVLPYVKPDVVITSSAPSGVCPGTPLTFTAVTTNSGNVIKYQWMVNNVNAGINSDVFKTAILNNNDIVTCNITPQNMPCLVVASVSSNPVTAVVFPLPMVSLPASQKILAGSSIILTPVISGEVSSYLWSPAAGLSTTTVKEPTASPQVNTTYTLTVTSANGCTASATTIVELSGGAISVKNTFTPNGDGVNDKWEILNLINYSKCTVAVFNRYGIRVFRSVGYANAWDGQFNNRPLPQGVYYYIIDLKDGSNLLTGSIAIVR